MEIGSMCSSVCDLEVQEQYCTKWAEFGFILKQVCE